MNSPRLENYKVNHLFLLIGENPLPNYVAAKLLLKEGGTLHLIHTSGTDKQAQRLETILNEEGFNQIQPKSLNDWESDAYHIQAEIKQRLESLPNSKPIGLNYTGGTKAMAVHAYRTAFKERPDTVFSYLDPRKLEMCIDREDRERDRIKVTPEDLQVKLTTIFKLHGLNLKQLPTQVSILPDAAKEFAQLFQDVDKARDWFTWFYNIFCKEARKKKANGEWGNWNSQTLLLNLYLSVDELPSEIVDVFRAKKFITSDNKLSLKGVQNRGIFTKLEYFCKWLDGIWLEHHVLEQVKSIVGSYFIQDHAMNFEIPLVGTKDGFEFDVAFTRGYQLFAISCSTTSNRSLCKSKLFEAYLRSQQMGGAEARVALVCCFDEPDSLKAELATLVGERQIAVFGRDDLLDIDERISEWIEDNDREAK
jgi:hypothetical protein